MDVCSFAVVAVVHGAGWSALIRWALQVPLPLHFLWLLTFLTEECHLSCSYCSVPVCVLELYVVLAFEQAGCSLLLGFDWDQIRWLLPPWGDKGPRWLISILFLGNFKHNDLQSVPVIQSSRPELCASTLILLWNSDIFLSLSKLLRICGFWAQLIKGIELAIYYFS